MKGHVKISRKHALLYVPYDETTDTVGSVKIKACSTLHIADVPNTFLVKSGVLLDEKSAVQTDGQHIELVMRNELVKDFISCVHNKEESLFTNVKFLMSKAYSDFPSPHDFTVKLH